jgi:hypothetical protein
MTVFVEEAYEWNVTHQAKLQTYIEWLEHYVTPYHNHVTGKCPQWDAIDLNIKEHAAWQQMCDDYWCLVEQEEKLDMAMFSLDMYHGTGWHAMHMRAMPGLYLYTDFLVVVIYNDAQAVQFKLACQ